MKGRLKVTQTVSGGAVISTFLLTPSLMLFFYYTTSCLILISIAQIPLWQRKISGEKRDVWETRAGEGHFLLQDSEDSQGCAGCWANRGTFQNPTKVKTLGPEAGTELTV